jgi:hypothetical protein
VDDDRLERALQTLWLGLASHPGLASPLVLPGPFRAPVVDPGVARVLAFGDVRGLIATAGGLVVVGRGGRHPIDAFVQGVLPAANGVVIIGEHLAMPAPEVSRRVQAACDLVGSALFAGRLERVTIGGGDAAYGEARVGPDADAAALVASAQTAFVTAAAALEPVAGRGGALIENGRRLDAADVLARACGNAVALRWRADRSEAVRAIADDLDELAVLAEPTAAGAELVAAIRARTDGAARIRRRALLVNVDADDFVYSFQFGRSVERRCVERGLRVDRIAVNPAKCGDIAAELGHALPAPIADGTEFLLDSEQDPSIGAVLDRLAARRHEVVVANVRPGVFYDLFSRGFFTVPTLLWDRHLHGGLPEERDRRGYDVSHLRGLRMRAWSLANKPDDGIQPSLARAGLEHGSGRPWPMDLEFFRSTVPRQAGLVFAGGDNGRDWPLFLEAVRELPFDVHLVSRQVPADVPPCVRVETRLPLWRFRDAMAAATVFALPLVPNVASGVTVLPMAMAMGVAVVATQSNWTEQYVRNGEEALLVPGADVAAFRAALVRLLDDDDLRARLVANARRRVAALCDLETFTREMFATFE